MVDVASKPRKVACIAMARNEGAYLTDWVFHHCHFGFNPLIVVLHDCSDQSATLLRELSRVLPIIVLDAKDASGLVCAEKSLQAACYELGLQCALERAADAAMFLDIDEFWVPKDFTTNIQDFLGSSTWPAVYGFFWANKWSDETPFGRPVENQNTLIMNRHIKSLMPLRYHIDALGVHAPVCRALPYLFADGSPQPRPGEAKQESPSIPSELMKAFILHRYWRSQLEYIAGLGRGMRQAVTGAAVIPASNSVELRTNRWGYLRGGNEMAWPVSAPLLDGYDLAHSKLLLEAGVVTRIVEEQYRVERQAQYVIREIPNWQRDPVKRMTLHDSLRGLSLAGLSS